MGWFFLSSQAGNRCDNGQSMKAKTKTFDAVAESRKWKEAVGKKIEGMTAEEIGAYFDRAAVCRRFNEALRRAEQAGKAKGEQQKPRR
jgi:hypothetical protein